jgi:hypothetical protein
MERDGWRLDGRLSWEVDEFSNSVVTGLPMLRLAPSLLRQTTGRGQSIQPYSMSSRWPSSAGSPRCSAVRRPIHGRLFEHQMVPTVVPSFSERCRLWCRTILLVAFRLASFCTEMTAERRTLCPKTDAANPKVVGVCGVNLHCIASIYIELHQKCERQESNLHALRHWILSPARLPIPPLSQERDPS